MDRRGFLSRLTAAATAMVAAAQSGGLVVASDEAERRRVGEWVRDNVLKPQRRLHDAQQAVIDVLRDCRVTQIARRDRAFGGPPEWVITYRQGDGVGINDADKPLPCCHLSHKQILDTGSPVSITVNYIAETLDISSLGNWGMLSREEPILEVEVVWYLP